MMSDDETKLLVSEDPSKRAESGFQQQHCTWRRAIVACVVGLTFAALAIGFQSIRSTVAAGRFGSFDGAAVIRDFDYSRCYNAVFNEQLKLSKVCKNTKSTMWNACTGKKALTCKSHAVRTYNDCNTAQSKCIRAMRNLCYKKKETPISELSECQKPEAPQSFSGGPDVKLLAGKSYRFFSMACNVGSKWCNKAVSAQSQKPQILPYDDFQLHEYMITPLKLEMASQTGEFYIKKTYGCPSLPTLPTIPPCSTSLSFAPQGAPKCPGATKGKDYKCERAAFVATSPTAFNFTNVLGKPDHFNIVAAGTQGWQLSTDEPKDCVRKRPVMTIEHLEKTYEWRLEPVN